MSANPESFAEHQAHAAKLYLGYVLKKHKGNVSHAAREAKLSRDVFSRYLRKYGVTVAVRAAGRPKAGDK